MSTIEQVLDVLESKPRAPGAARLRIEMKDPDSKCVRLLPRDLRVFLNDVEIDTFTELSFSFGISSPVVKAKIELYLDRIEVDAVVLAELQELCTNPPKLDGTTAQSMFAGS